MPSEKEQFRLSSYFWVYVTKISCPKIDKIYMFYHPFPFLCDNYFQRTFIWLDILK